jgi:hypothetical protein
MYPTYLEVHHPVGTQPAGNQAEALLVQEIHQAVRSGSQLPGNPVHQHQQPAPAILVLHHGLLAAKYPSLPA